jgi:hypothetical protein
MKVRALAATGKDLPEEFLETGWTPRSRFDLTVGREYAVRGICLTGRALEYLVEDDGQMPQWYPAAVFAVTDNHLPPGWRFRIFSPGSLVTAVWGYAELTDERHFDALSERDPNALRIFGDQRDADDRLQTPG